MTAAPLTLSPEAVAAYNEHAELGFDLAGEAFREAQQRLAGPLTPKALAECVASALHSGDQLMESWRPALTRANGRDVACRAGCSVCCHTHVFATTSELATIAWALGGAEAADARATFAAQGAAVAGLDHMARMRQGIACGALEGGRCAVYQVRPGVCRGYVSLSRVACEKDWRQRHNPRAKAHVPTVAPFQMVGVMVVMGVDLWLHRRGLELERVEIGQGMAAILEPGALEAWIAGERVFAAATPQARRGHYAEALEGLGRRMGA